MPNVGQILKAHNKKITQQQQQQQAENVQQNKTCNCRDSSQCPMQGNCQAKSLVYQATVTTDKQQSFTYIGLTEHEFKKRWYNHCQSFKHRKYENSTELSKLI